MTKIKWRDMADELWDSDGCNPDADHLPALMREFRDQGSVSDYFFVDTSKPGEGPDEDQYPDSWNDDELRSSCECGPEPEDIDFTGLT